MSVAHSKENGASSPGICRTHWLLCSLGVALSILALLVVVIWARGRPVPPPEERGKLVFSDDFERSEIGDRYLQAAPDRGWKAGPWRIEHGWLVGKDIHNAALWLQLELPEKARIELDVRADSKVGDVKCEVFGDGEHHQSGYILIFGGWKNSVNCIARQDEHAEDRREDRRLRVEPDVDYHWTITRTDHTVRWYIDGELFLIYDDRNPVRGRHFGFNNWEAPTRFDNLKIYDIGS